MRQMGGARTRGLVTAVLAAMSLLAGCTALPADASWSPPAWPQGASIDTVLDGPSSSTEPVVSPSVDTAGLIDGRIRNDRAGLQARYVEVVGMGDFNGRVRSIVDAAIESTGDSSFTPEVFGVEAGLADRGCTDGAIEVPAAEMLADPAFGPVGGDGTALVCEVVAAFGPILGVSFRTVAGASGVVASDETTTLFLDLETGGVTDGAEIWTPDAAAALWNDAVEKLRRDAGALSAAPLKSPSDEQFALAGAALNGARVGGEFIHVTLPAGITSEELVALGLPATEQPLTVTLDVMEGGAVAPDGWLTPEGERVFASHSAPFVGVPAWNGARSIDCALVACVAVTYDDGPSGFTSELLDTLALHESSATFFMLGSAVNRNPDIVARAARDGHELASHTMTHPDLTKITSDKAREQVHEAGEAITNVTGQPVTMYRPPYGALDPAVRSAVGWPAILWTIDTLDWQSPGEEALVSRSVDPANPGNIILFHDSHAASVNAAGNVLEGLKNRGFTPVTVTQLFNGAVPNERVFSQ